MINDPGTLDKRISIVGTIAGTDADGFDTVAQGVICKCWARIEPARGKEYYESQKTGTAEAVKITIRYRASIKESFSVQYGSHIYAINSIVNPYMSNESLELYCSEKLRGGDPNNG